MALFLFISLLSYLSASTDYWKIDLSTSDVEYLKRKIKEQKLIRGIHLTSWVAGDDKKRAEIISHIKNSVINTVVIAVREKNGEVYIPQVNFSLRYGSYLPVMKDPKKVVDDFKREGLYVIARIVCFHDNITPKKNPNLAVRKADGSLWRSRRGDTWLDPYNKENWNYILEVAKKCAEYGFDEVQLDYVRYPTEGDVSECVFSKPHNKANAMRNIVEFIKHIKNEMKDYGVKVSVDVFGLTTASDMGIGQNLLMISDIADRVYPMMYPSHYYTSVYGISYPEIEPYKVINRGLEEAIKAVGKNYYKITPYLQDFSLKVKYTPYHVRAQIIAAKNNMIDSFILWNPSSNYSWSLLKKEVFCSLIEPEKCFND